MTLNKCKYNEPLTATKHPSAEVVHELGQCSSRHASYALRRITDTHLKYTSASQRYTDHLRDTLIIFSGLQVNIMVSCDTETAENTETAWLECKSLLLSSDKSHIFSNTTRLNREQWGFAWSHMSLHFPFPHWSSSQYWSTASYEYWWPVSPEKNTPVISRFRRDLLRFNLNMNLFHPWLSLSCSTFILSL